MTSYRNTGKQVMKVDGVPEGIKREVWKRDEFTCRYCGSTTSWEDVEIIFDIPPEKGGTLDLSNLMTVCSRCLSEGKTGPVTEKEKMRVLSLVRELLSYPSFSEEIIFEDDYEEEIMKLGEKVESLKEDNRKLSAALQERDRMAIAYKKKMDRALKDLENYRSRVRKEVDLEVRKKTGPLLNSMIEALDNLGRAIDGIGTGKQDSESIISGLRSIRKAVLSEMEKQGVVRMDPIGRPFDPNSQEAIGTVEDESVCSDTVVRVEQEGFEFRDKVLRAAKVIVSKGGPKRSEGDPGEDDTCFVLDEDEIPSEEMEELEEMEISEDKGPRQDDVIIVKPRAREK